MPGRRRARAAVIFVVVTLAATACTSDTGRTRSSPAAEATALGGQASQNASDARRDGVVPEVAALTFRDRVDRIATVRVDDETWAVSRPTSRGLSKIGCEEEREGAYGIDYVCGVEYGELLKLDGRRIVRAYPLPSLPPQHIAITDDAVFCARQGDGGLPDSMACRVDRSSLALNVRVFPNETEPGVWTETGTTLPEGWTVDDEHLEVTKFVADDAGVWAQSSERDWTKLDPDTLEIVERDIERVTTDV
jgi:hypothetical protein